MGSAPAPSNIQTPTYTTGAKNTWLFYLTSWGWNIQAAARGDCRPLDCTAPITKSFETSSNRNLWTNPTLEFRMLLASWSFTPRGQINPCQPVLYGLSPPPITCMPALLPSVCPVKNKSQTVSLNIGQGYVFLHHKRCVTASTRMINQTMTLWLLFFFSHKVLESYSLFSVLIDIQWWNDFEHQHFITENKKMREGLQERSTMIFFRLWDLCERNPDDTSAQMLY